MTFHGTQQHFKMTSSTGEIPAEYAELKNNRISLRYCTTKGYAIELFKITLDAICRVYQYKSAAWGMAIRARLQRI